MMIYQVRLYTDLSSKVYPVRSKYQINLKNCNKLVIVVSGTLRQTEQHTKSWTKTEHGKVKQYDVKQNGHT